MEDLVRHQSIWSSGDPAFKSRYPRLEGTHPVDVVVVGAGITGATTARLLKAEGLKVALVTSTMVGEGATGSTTAHLVSVPDISLTELKRKFGVDQARLTIESLNSALHRIEMYTRGMPAEVEFARVPAYKFAETTAERDSLQEEAEMAETLGVRAHWQDQLELPFATSGALRFEHQALFHPLRYLRHLVAEIPGQGSFVFENTHVEGIEDGSPALVHTQNGTLRAYAVVLCTHSPVGVYLSLHTRVAPYLSYVTAFRSEAMPHAALYFDTNNPYFYLRPLSAEDRSVWIVGGCDHKTGQCLDTNNPFAELEQYVRSRFPEPQFLNRWCSELYESVDGLPYIGRIAFSDNLYTGTGFAGVGMTFGTLAAMMNSDLILGRENQYVQLYSPSRVKPLASVARFTKENANAVRFYFGDRINPSELKSVDEITPGTGQVLDLGDRKFAVYRDDHGFLHVFSPVCTHLGGILHWNQAERTWDCPLHGGRFRCTGEILEGPPLKDLSAEYLQSGEPTGTVLVHDPLVLPTDPFPLSP